MSFVASCFLLVTATADARGEDWKFDVLKLKNGGSFTGAITEEDRETLHFKFVVRKPGSRTIVIDTSFTKSEIEKIARLAEADRKALLRRLEELDQGGQREQARMKALKLETIDWPGGGKGWRYSGKFFRFESNAREDLVRQAAVRLEDIYAAFTARLGAPCKPKELTRITLMRSLDEYAQVLKRMKLDILNPAFYDPHNNQIVAASDLERRAEELEKLRAKHDAILEELTAQEKKMKRHYHGKPPAALLAQFWHLRRDVQGVNLENAEAFEKLKDPLFAMLYHEAFHAYLDSFVYPSAENNVPRWLNEGLAQIFETAIVESGELRVGHVDPRRLDALKDALKKSKLVPLKEILKAELRDFSLAHRSDQHIADKYFLTSWALAYYLTFERRMLGSDALTKYVQATTRGGNPGEAFRDLVDQPLADFEAEFHKYLAGLRPEGSTRDGMPDPASSAPAPRR